MKVSNPLRRDTSPFSGVNMQEVDASLEQTFRLQASRANTAKPSNESSHNVSKAKPTEKASLDDFLGNSFYS